MLAVRLLIELLLASPVELRMAPYLLQAPKLLPFLEGPLALDLALCRRIPAGAPLPIGRCVGAVVGVLVVEASPARMSRRPGRLATPLRIRFGVGIGVLVEEVSRATHPHMVVDARVLFQYLQLRVPLGVGPGGPIRLAA